MAYTVTPNIPLNMPTPGTREPAQIALLNENCVQLSNHDHTTGKALAVGRLRSGLNANRPAAGTAGNVYFATDTGAFYVDTGTAWVQFITSGGQATVTGWTLIDPIIRDTLQWGPEGSGTIDYTMTRTGAQAMQFSGNVGIGVAPAAWPYKALQVGDLGLHSEAGVGYQGDLLFNSYQATTGGEFRAPAATYAGSRLRMQNGVLSYATAPAVAAGAVQTFTTRLTVDNGSLRYTPAASGGITAEASAGEAYLYLSAPDAQYRTVRYAVNGTGAQRWMVGTNPGSANYNVFRYNDAGVFVGVPLSIDRATGTVTLTPDAGQYGLIMGSASFSPSAFSDNNSLMIAATTYIGVNPTGNYFMPARDGAINSGSGAQRWGTVFAVVGSINTSHVSMKEHFVALDPGACAQAVLDTQWWEFDYKPPALPERPDDLDDEQWDERLSKHQQSVDDTADARHARGYVLGSPDHAVSDLFGVRDRKSGAVSSDLAVVAAALQDTLRRLAAVEARLNAPT